MDKPSITKWGVRRASDGLVRGTLPEEGYNDRGISPISSCSEEISESKRPARGEGED